MSPFNEIRFCLEILLFPHLWPQGEDQAKHIHFWLSPAEGLSKPKQIAARIQNKQTPRSKGKTFCQDKNEASIQI